MNKTRLALFLLLIIFSCKGGHLENDEQLQSFLKNNDLQYELDEEGDYKLSAIENGLSRDVWISGTINYNADAGIREIFSISAAISGDELESIAPVLLMDNVQTRVIGNWAIMKHDSQDEYVTLYLVKAPLNADDDFLIHAIAEAADASATLERVLDPAGD